MQVGPDLFLDDISPGIVDYEGALLHHPELLCSAITHIRLLTASLHSNTSPTSQLGRLNVKASINSCTLVRHNA